jgi:hypothetical protein
LIVEQASREDWAAEESEIANAVAEESKPKAGKKKAKVVAVTNLRANPNKRLGLAGFGSVELTPEQTDDAQFMARISRAVETGVLSIN